MSRRTFVWLYCGTLNQAVTLPKPSQVCICIWQVTLLPSQLVKIVCDRVVWVEFQSYIIETWANGYKMSLVLHLPPVAQTTDPFLVWNVGIMSGFHCYWQTSHTQASHTLLPPTVLIFTTYVSLCPWSIFQCSIKIQSTAWPWFGSIFIDCNVQQMYECLNVLSIFIVTCCVTIPWLVHDHWCIPTCAKCVYIIVAVLSSLPPSDSLSLSSGYWSFMFPCFVYTMHGLLVTSTIIAQSLHCDL